MDAIKLSGQYSLGIEVETKRLRLIVFCGEEELVCHKSTFKELNDFLAGSFSSLFKGRLQLKKSTDNVLVQVKGEIVGAISNETFRNLFENQFVSN